MEVNRIHYSRSRKLLELTFANGEDYSLSAEFLRVHSPSAEVRGHGPGEETLQTGKAAVGVTDIRPVGHYAIQLHFDDGHDSGIYSWDYLYTLATTEQRLWQRYLKQLEAAGASREPDIQVLTFTP